MGMAQVFKAWPGSLRSLAREAGVSHVTLRRLRAGEGNPSAETAVRLARALEDTGRRCQRAAKVLRRATT
jgi:transcriptional regulator with XRE-family HTH domain